MAAAAPSGRRCAEPPPAPPVARARFRGKDTEQYHLCIGARGIARTDERRFALRVLDSLLGGTSSSRLFQAVREQRGLAYSIFTFQSLYAHTGQIGLYVGTRPENLEQVVSVLADELKRIREEPVEREELERARDNVKGRVVLALESTAARMDRLGASVLAGMPILELDETIARIDAVSAEAVGELARELLEREPLCVAAIGPQEERLPRGDRAAAGGRREHAVIAVGVAGAAGRMGLAVCDAVSSASDMELAGRADPRLGVELAEILADCEVLVDFTQPDTALQNARRAVAAGVHVVIGTTGFDVAQLDGLDGANVFAAPNFAIGAVLMMRFAAQAAAHMQAAEIIELHHDGKLDAPSGTAARTAALMAAASGRPAPPIHSVRLPGLVAHQEVILGDVGQTLTIRHDSTDRESFMPGVLLAIRRVGALAQTPLVGLERLLFAD